MRDVAAQAGEPVESLAACRTCRHCSKIDRVIGEPGRGQYTAPDRAMRFVALARIFHQAACSTNKYRLISIG